MAPESGAWQEGAANFAATCSSSCRKVHAAQPAVQTAISCPAGGNSLGACMHTVLAVWHN